MILFASASEIARIYVSPSLRPRTKPEAPAQRARRRPLPPLAPTHLRARALPARGSGRRLHLAATITEARRHSQIAQGGGHALSRPSVRLRRRSRPAGVPS